MPDYTGAATGALSGAGTGFAIGGPIGAAVGGLAGGAAGLFGKKKKKKRSTFDKNQQQLHSEQYGAFHGEGPLSDLYSYDPEQANQVFDQTIGRKAQRDFQENTIPGLTGAFRSNGLQNSSYLGESLSKAGRDVQESLDALRSKYLYEEQSNAKNAKRNAINEYQNRTTFDVDVGQKNFDISSILNSISPEMKAGLKDYFSGEKATAGTA